MSGNYSPAPPASSTSPNAYQPGSRSASQSAASSAPLGEHAAVAGAVSELDRLAIAGEQHLVLAGHVARASGVDADPFDSRGASPPRPWTRVVEVVADRLHVVVEDRLRGARGGVALGVVVRLRQLHVVTGGARRRPADRRRSAATPRAKFDP